MEVVEEHFDDPWLAPLADHIRNSGVTEDETMPGHARADEAVLHRPARGGPLRPLRGAPARHAPALGGRRAGTRRGGLAVRALAAARRTHRPTEPGGAPRERLPPAPGGVRPPRPPATVLVVRADAAARELPRRPRRRRLPARRQSLPPPPVPRALETPGRAGRSGHQALATSAKTRRSSAARNPLLASWGRDAREMQLVLGGAETHADVA